MARRTRRELERTRKRTRPAAMCPVWRATSCILAIVTWTAANLSPLLLLLLLVAGGHVAKSGERMSALVPRREVGAPDSTSSSSSSSVVARIGIRRVLGLGQHIGRRSPSPALVGPDTGASHKGRTPVSGAALLSLLLLGLAVAAASCG
jgi:hypothetical protein